MRIDLSKPVQTRDGRAARIVSEKGPGAFPILAIISYPDGTENIHRYTLAGNAMFVPGETEDDLVNVPDTVEEVAYVSLGDSYSGKPTGRHPGWPIIKLSLKVGRDKGVEDVREVLSAEVVDA